MNIVIYNDNLKDQVSRFIQKIWLELGRTWDPNGRNKDILTIPQTYQAAGGEFWVALSDDNEVIGTHALKSLGEGVGELGRLYLDASYRGQGIGRALVRAAIEGARERGFRVLRLDTSRELKRAYNLLQKMGFRETGFCIDDQHPEVFMELEL